MTISDKSIQEFKEIYNKKYGKNLTDAEAREQSENLLGFFDIIFQQAVKEHQRRKRLKLEEIKGFYLENEDGHYTCSVCRETFPAKDIWWNPRGQWCRDCWRNIKKRVIPSLSFKNDDKTWIQEWEIKHKFGVHPATREKLKRDGLLKGRDLKRKDGTIYCTVYLVKENEDFLKKYPKKQEMKVKFISNDNEKNA